MKKAITLSCIDGILRFLTLFLIIDLSVSVYTDSIFSIIAALLFIAVYYVISHFIAKKVTSKKTPRVLDFKPRRIHLVAYYLGNCGQNRRCGNTYFPPRSLGHRRRLGGNPALYRACHCIGN